MTYTTKIRNESNLKLTPSLRLLLRTAVSRTLQAEVIELPCEVSILLTLSEDIRVLNRQYRDKDSPTDVLSFPLYDSAEELQNDANANAKAEFFALGDIVIAPEVVDVEAKELSEPFEKHLCRMCIHSVLHLLGYDHERGEAEEQEMYQKQESILRTLWN